MIGNLMPYLKTYHGTLIAKLNQPIVPVKAKAIIIMIVCGIFISTIAQNAGFSGAGGNQSPRAVNTGNVSIISGSNALLSSTNYNNRRRIIEPGLNNPYLNNSNHQNNPNGSHGIITNGFGSKAVTNGFGYGGITNGFGSSDITNGFGGSTNGFGSGGYSNRWNDYRTPYTTDPRVMGKSGLNSTN
jgi:hypothetical protein